MRLRSVIGGLVCGFAIFALAKPAAAQGTQVDFAGGYQFFRFLENGGANVPNGWGASIAAGREWVKVVGDVGGHYKNGAAFHTFQGGVEFSGKSKRVAPFARLVTGVALFSGGGESDTAYVLTPEAGVKLLGNDHVGVQTSVGFPFMFANGDHAKGFRFFAGIVLRK